MLSARPHPSLLSRPDRHLLEQGDLGEPQLDKPTTTFHITNHVASSKLLSSIIAQILEQRPWSSASGDQYPRAMTLFTALDIPASSDRSTLLRACGIWEDWSAFSRILLSLVVALGCIQATSGKSSAGSEEAVAAMQEVVTGLRNGRGRHAKHRKVVLPAIAPETPQAPAQAVTTPKETTTTTTTEAAPVPPIKLRLKTTPIDSDKPTTSKDKGKSVDRGAREALASDPSTSKVGPKRAVAVPDPTSSSTRPAPSGLMVPDRSVYPVVEIPPLPSRKVSPLKRPEATKTSEKRARDDSKDEISDTDSEEEEEPPRKSAKHTPATSVRGTSRKKANKKAPSAAKKAVSKTTKKGAKTTAKAGPSKAEVSKGKGKDPAEAVSRVKDAWGKDKSSIRKVSSLNGFLHQRPTDFDLVLRSSPSLTYGLSSKTARSPSNLELQS